MKPVWKATVIVLVVAAILDVAIRRYAHPEFWWHTIPAFDLVYGFVGCAAIVLFSKWLGHKFLARDEGYYEQDR